MRTKISLLLLACALSLFAGDIERVAATYEYISDNSNETPAQRLIASVHRSKTPCLSSSRRIRLARLMTVNQVLIGVTSLCLANCLIKPSLNSLQIIKRKILQWLSEQVLYPLGNNKGWGSASPFLFLGTIIVNIRKRIVERSKEKPYETILFLYDGADGRFDHARAVCGV